MTSQVTYRTWRAIIYTYPGAGPYIMCPLASGRGVLFAHDPTSYDVIR